MRANITRREANKVIKAFGLKVGFDKYRKVWVARFSGLQCSGRHYVAVVENLARQIGGGLNG